MERLRLRNTARKNSLWGPENKNPPDEWKVRAAYPGGRCPAEGTEEE